MRFSLVLCGLISLTPLAMAQTAPPPSGSSWARVQALPAGTPVHMSTAHSGGLCHIRSVDAETLTCAHGSKDTVIPRAEIKSITLTRRTASTLGMAGVGVGLSAIAVSVTSSAVDYHGSAKGAVWAGAAGLGVVIFAPIGYFSDIFRGPIIYTAP
jgi:hypothetical protein